MLKIRFIGGLITLVALAKAALTSELPESTYYLLKIKPGIKIDSLFSNDSLWVLCRINKMSPIYLGSAEVIKVPHDFEWAKNWSPFPETLRAFRDSIKVIYIDLSHQWLGAYEKGVMVNSFPICSGVKGVGKRGRLSFTTPTGEFKINWKCKKSWSKTFKVWIWWQLGFYDRFVIHASAYLPGYPATHGCIRLFYPDAKWLYKWAPINTPVIIVK